MFRMLCTPTHCTVTSKPVKGWMEYCSCVAPGVGEQIPVLCPTTVTVGRNWDSYTMQWNYHRSCILPSLKFRPVAGVKHCLHLCISQETFHDGCFTQNCHVAGREKKSDISSSRNNEKEKVEMELFPPLVTELPDEIHETEIFLVGILWKWSLN